MVGGHAVGFGQFGGGGGGHAAGAGFDAGELAAAEAGDVFG